MLGSAEIVGEFVGKWGTYETTSLKLQVGLVHTRQEPLQQHQTGGVHYIDSGLLETVKCYKEDIRLPLTPPCKRNKEKCHFCLVKPSISSDFGGFRLGRDDNGTWRENEQLKTCYFCCYTALMVTSSFICFWTIFVHES